MKIGSTLRNVRCMISKSAIWFFVLQHSLGLTQFTFNGSAFNFTSLHVELTIIKLIRNSIFEVFIINGRKVFKVMLFDLLQITLNK